MTIDNQNLQIPLKYNRLAFPLNLLIRIVLDYLVALLVVYLSMDVRGVLLNSNSVMPLYNIYKFAILPLSFMIFANVYGLYTKRMQFSEEILYVLKSTCFGALTVAVILYLTQDAASTSRLFMVLWGLLIFPCISLERFILKCIVKNNNFFATPALLLLGGDVDMKVVNELHHTMNIRYNYIGYLSYNHIPQEQLLSEEIPHIGIWEDAPNIIQKYRIDDAFIIAHKLPLSGIEQLVAILQPIVKHISIVPTLGKLPLNSVDLTTLLDGRYVMLSLHNNLKLWYNRLAKFIFDYVLTLLGVILISPVLLLIMIAIKLDSKGPAIFVQERIGYGGKVFKCYKFRSMWKDAEERLTQILDNDPLLREEWNTFHKMHNDPRITRVGKFLRATSLDELPQLFNILKGEMSLVGPRPCYASELACYGDLVKDYFAVRPAITGPWQTSGRNSLDFEDRVRLDIWYVKNWTLWLDIIILWRTIKVVLKRNGAY